MRIPRFFSPAPLAAGTEVALDSTAAQHAVAVLRLGPGASLVLFDGTGGEHPAELVHATKAAGSFVVRAKIGAQHAPELELPFPVTLGQALAKGERMDLVVQKATELGASALVALATERSEVKLDAERAAKRVAHWQGVVRAACEQCGRNRLMQVAAPQALDAFLMTGLLERQGTAGAGALRLVLAPDGAPLRDLPRPNAAGVVLLVGPEGGLSEAELARVGAAGFVRASLGPRVLRTETAAIAALAAIQALWG